VLPCATTLAIDKGDVVVVIFAKAIVTSAITEDLLTCLTSLCAVLDVHGVCRFGRGFPKRKRRRLEAILMDKGDAYHPSFNTSMYWSAASVVGL